MSASTLNRLLAAAAKDGVKGLHARLVEGCSSEPYLAAVGLLAEFKDGFWLRRLTDPDFSHEYIEISDAGLLGKYYVTINFRAITLPLSAGILGGTSCELAMLQMACSIAGRDHTVNLRALIRHLNDYHLRLVFMAMKEAR